MPYRLVRAEPIRGDLTELYDRVDEGEIEAMEPFGESMTTALREARYDPATGEAVWIEEDYCSPPLAMEREKVLDDYFDPLDVVDEDVDETAGWDRIDELPKLREIVAGETQDEA